jgi:hypothetical protein
VSSHKVVLQRSNLVPKNQRIRTNAALGKVTLVLTVTWTFYFAQVHIYKSIFQLFVLVGKSI